MLRPGNGVVSIPHELGRIDQSSSPRGDVYRQCAHGQQDEGDADVGRGICGADAEYEAAEKRLSASAAVSPISRPTSTGRNSSTKTNLASRRRPAPKADRIASSRLLAPTENAAIAYTPIAESATATSPKNREAARSSDAD